MMTTHTHTHAYIIEAQVVRQTCKKKQFQCAVTVATTGMWAHCLVLVFILIFRIWHCLFYRVGAK